MSRTASFCALGLILGSSYVVELLEYFRQFYSVLEHHCKYHVKRDIFIEDSKGRYLGINIWELLDILKTSKSRKFLAQTLAYK